MNKKIWWILGLVLVLAAVAINAPAMQGNPIEKTLASQEMWRVTFKSDNDSSGTKAYLKVEDDRLWISASYKDVKNKETTDPIVTLQYLDNKTVNVLISNEKDSVTTYAGGVKLTVDKLRRDDITANVVDYKGDKLGASVELVPYTGDGSEDSESH